MPPPKTQKLLREELAAIDRDEHDVVNMPTYTPDDVIKIKQIKCYNEFVAILQFRIKSGDVILTEASSYKKEGMVIGFGPGAPANDGKRCPSQLKLGDVIAFYGNPIITLKPTAGIYAGQQVIIISERAVLCELPPVNFEIVSNEKPEASD